MGTTAFDTDNLVVLRGTVVAAPRLRQLPSGTAVAEFDLTTRGPSGTVSVPISWPDAPAETGALDAGADVVVVGTVRRRFFRAGGVTASRTEVVPIRLVPSRRRAEAQRLVDRAAAAVAADRSAESAP